MSVTAVNSKGSSFGNPRGMLAGHGRPKLHLKNAPSRDAPSRAQAEKLGCNLRARREDTVDRKETYS